MARWFHARTVVESNDAASTADSLESSFGRFDEAYSALKWLLARRCDKIGSLSRDAGGVTYRLYKVAADELAHTPALLVLYTFDDDEVEIVALKAEHEVDED